MKARLNLLSLLGLVLFLTPLLWFAHHGTASKPAAFKAELVTLSGLALACVGAWCQFLLKRMERLQQERHARRAMPICYDVTPETSSAPFPPSAF